MTTTSTTTSFYANPNAPSDTVPLQPQVVVPPNTQIVAYAVATQAANGLSWVLTDANNNVLLPVNTAAPAIGYPSNGKGNSFTWNIAAQYWNA